MSTAPLQNVEVATASKSSKEALEEQKLRLEIEQMRRPWYAQPPTWFNGGALVLALIGAYITMRFQAHQSDLKILKADVETQKAVFAVDQAKVAQQRAEAERDKAIVDAQAAGDRARISKEEVHSAMARLEKCRRLMTELGSVAQDIKKTGVFSEKGWQALDALGDTIYNVSINTVGTAPTDDHVAKRIVQFTSDPPGMQVYLAVGTYMSEDKEANYISPHSIGGIRNKEQHFLVGTTPCTAKVPIGTNYVKFYSDAEHEHGRYFVVK